MGVNCLICNSDLEINSRNNTNLFGENCSLLSGKKLCDLVSEVVDTQLSQTTIHSKVICKICINSFTEYDTLHTRLKNMKCEFLEMFKKTLSSQGMKYETSPYPTSDVSKLPPNSNNTTKLQGKRLVLPASKLQPLPPNFVINVNDLSSMIKSNVVPVKLKPALTTLAPSTLNLKVTVGSSVLTQSIKTTGSIVNKVIQNNSVGIKARSITPTILQNVNTKNSVSTLSSVLNNRKMKSIDTKLLLEGTPTSILNLDSNINNNLSSAMLLKKSVEELDLDETDIIQNVSGTMDIQRDCSYSIVPTTDQQQITMVTYNEKNNVVATSTHQNNEKPGNSSHQGYFEENMLPSLDDAAEYGGDDDKDEYIIAKLENFDSDEIEGETIVLEDTSSILQVVSGNKLQYIDDMSLEMQSDNEDSQMDDKDSHDSNDESQIELQVSGDEETANAIIAAAKEEGGAFIKVESGEMYKVQSVLSKLKEPLCNKTDYAQPIVSKEGSEFRCLLCEKGDDNINDDAGFIGDADAVMNHMKNQHDARVYICQKCGKFVRKKSEYLQHIATHDKKSNKIEQLGKFKLHECDICGRKYTSRTLLKEHINIHTGFRPHVCRECGKTFASKYTYMTHLVTHTDRPRPFKCNQCGKSFFTQQNLNQHEKTHSGVKDFHCNICGKAFGTQHNLEVHGVVHSGQKPFLCGICSKGFARRAEVRDHMRIHTGERPFECDICGAAFSQRSNLQSHKRATHFNDKRYHCTQCPKRFKRRRLLDYHIKASHTGERPLKCEICGATFVYPEHYKKHIRIHSGEKPYDCEVCGKRFNSRDNRNTHRFTHSEKKPYECLICGAGYMRKQLLYTHMHNSGHMAESIVVNQPRVAKLLQISEEETVTDNKSSFELNTDAATMLSINNADGEVSASLLDQINGATIQDAQLGNTTEDGMFRLVQIQLSDGSDGWIAVNQGSLPQPT